MNKQAFTYEPKTVPEEFVKRLLEAFNMERTELKIVDYKLFEEPTVSYYILYCEDKNAKLYEVVVKLPDSMDEKVIRDFIEAIL